MVFITLFSLLLAGFFVYHRNICLTNKKTIETLSGENKWRGQFGEEDGRSKGKCCYSQCSHDQHGAGTLSKWRGL
ncbi:hypothetical protein BRARA_B03535 [Brassica rapa]|uniref:Uncharacterized protein n=1 Tax=Brassica campestris TaxID=3711 RepID=A0A398ALW5_BRACM|nr:hypothetical protein BRARA_B03535 [Brassica rapa]